MSAKAASLFAFLSGGLWLLDEPKPVVYVNEGSSFMSTWPSEAIAGSPLPPECNFWNQSVVFSSEMCSLFVVNRAAAAYQVRTVHSNHTFPRISVHFCSPRTPTNSGSLTRVHVLHTSQPPHPTVPVLPNPDQLCLFL